MCGVQKVLRQAIAEHFCSDKAIKTHSDFCLNFCRSENNLPSVVKQLYICLACKVSGGLENKKKYGHPNTSI